MILTKQNPRVESVNKTEMNFSRVFFKFYLEDGQNSKK